MEENIFEKACILMNGVCNLSGECYAFKKFWGENGVCSEIDAYFSRHKQDEGFWRKVFSLSEKEKLILGFRYYEQGDSKMNIPIWIWNLLPDDMYIEDGGKTVKELDNDTRFGCVFWRA